MAIAQFPAGPPWAMAERDAAHTAQSNAVAPEDPGVLGAPWPFTTGGAILGAAVVDYAGTAYVGSRDGWLYSVGSSGRGGPIYNARSPIEVTPAIVADVPSPAAGEGSVGSPPAIYFGTVDGALHAVSASGHPRWVIAPGISQANTFPLRSSAVAVNRGTNQIYVGSDSGAVFGVTETSTGSALTMWEATCAAPVQTAPAVSRAGDVVYVGAPDGRLHAFDALSGGPLAGSPVQVSWTALTSPVVSERTIIVASADGVLSAYDASLQLLWQTTLGHPVAAAPALGVDGEVLVLTLYALVAVDSTGTLLWSEQFPGHKFFGASPAVDAAGTTVVAAASGWVFGVSRQITASGVRTAWGLQLDPTGPKPSSLSLDGYGRVLVPSKNARLYVLDEDPAFRLAYQSDVSVAGNIDIHTLRESYGVVDPARGLRVTDNAADDVEPAYSLDRSVLAFVSNRSGSPDAFLATAVGTGAQNVSGTPSTTVEADVAFTPVDDITNVPRPPHVLPYLAMTTNATGTDRLIFVDLVAQAAGVVAQRSFTDWAGSLGVPPAILTQLEPPGSGQSQVAFSPDGRKVVWRHCEPLTQSGEVRLLALTGAGWQLSTLGPPYIVDLEARHPCLDEPCFAPDSRWIALRDRGVLAVYDSVGTLAPVFAKAPGPLAEPAHPNWSPDGTEIAVGLDVAGRVDVHIASGAGYKAFSGLTSTATSDQPYFSHDKTPPPRIVGIAPDRQVPGGSIEIQGRGFDILHPQNNLVLFTDTLRGSLRPAAVLSARVNPYLGLGVLTVRVPSLAGHGQVTVETRFGSAASAAFHVLPEPSRLVAARSVPGAQIRVFGVGLDLSPATANEVSFTSAAGGQITVPATGGGVDGNEEFLVITVPTGVAETGPVTVSNLYGGSPAGPLFSRLHPTISLVRTTGLPQYSLQGATGVLVRFVGAEFPYDPYFSQGTSVANVSVVPTLAGPAAPVQIRTVTFVPTGKDTAGLGPDVFPFPGLGPSHPGGDLAVTAADAALAAAAASAPFRVPLTNIPIIFVPGTSGSSLDIAAGTPTPLVGTQPLDLHTFPWLCKTCLPGTGPLAPIAHLPRSILYNPGTPAPGRPADPRGPRVWIGAEAVLDLVAGTPFGNQGNHYLDALAFTAAGLPAQPAVVPGTVFRDVLIEPPVVSGSTAWGFKSVYEPVVSFLLTPSATLGWPGRPLCTSGATGPCITASGAPASGANAVYLFNLDWRAGLDGTGGRSAEQDRLAAFVDSVLARPDVPVKRVVLITHSYGGPVARTYYLDPKNGANAKVDQMISFGGGFGGVIEPFDILERGSTWGFGVSFPGVSLGFAEWETKALAQNWPTAYMQQPNSEDWFADHGSAIGGQLVNRSFVRDHRLLGAGELTSWAASMSWVRSRHNAILTDSQTTFFASPALPVSLGDFRGGTGAIYHHRIIGHGRMDTKVATVVVHLPSLAASLPLGALNPVEWWPTEWSWPVYGDGDSTIPYHGALGLTDPRDDRIYIIEKVVHSDLPNVPQVVGAPGSPSVKGLLQLLLEGATGAQPQAPSAFRSQNQVTENVGGSVIPLLQPIRSDDAGEDGSEEDSSPAGRGAQDRGQVAPDRWLLEVRGLASLSIEDADGRRVGPARDPDRLGTVELQIPGVSYTPGLVVNTAFVDRPGPLTVTLTSQIANTVNVYLDLFNVIGNFGTYFFRGVPVAPAGGARLRFDVTDTRPGAFVSDSPAGGEAVVTRPTVLTRDARQTTQPPATSLEINDGMVTVSAVPSSMDNPVARSRVTTDGLTHRIYERLFPVPDDAKVVMAYSEDIAGNLEYPGPARPVLGVSASEVTLADERDVAHVDVLNLDPLRVTGELDCVAEADADWVMLEGGRGATPYTVTVRLADTRPDGAATITVRTGAEGALFAERKVSVKQATTPI